MGLDARPNQITLVHVYYNESTMFAERNPQF
jgi:hypothetical protein